MKTTLSYRQFKRLFGESLFLEGKHWPEDYIKTAFNTIKNSELGQQSWVTDDYINQTLNMFVKAFGPLSHKNSNLGYFATIIRWFVAYAGSNKSKYQEFIERKLDGIIKTLLWLSNNPSEESKLKEQIKTKWTFEDFEKYQKNLEDQISKEQSDKLSNVKLEDKGYEIIEIDSYKQLHGMFGGDKTGYKGQSEWCHTNGKSTYDTWIEDGKNTFFILAKKNWQEIEPPDPKTTNAYDEYGTSLIALLVNVTSLQLKNATLRWNHIIEPSETIPGTSVDKAFLGWGDLAEVTGRDVKKEIEETLKDRRDALQAKIEDANRQVNEYLERNKDKIKKLDTDSNFLMFNKFKELVTDIKIPYGITSIGNRAFYYCSNLISITIPDSVKSIGDGAFYGCSNLTSITIPNSVKSIGTRAFNKCTNLTSITIPDNVRIIEDAVFSSCTNLKSITIPDSVTSIGEGAFFNCSSLTSVTIGNGVTSIGYKAFYGCINLTSVIIPDSVMGIGDQVFWKCKNLKTLKILNKELANEILKDRSRILDT